MNKEELFQCNEAKLKTEKINALGRELTIRELDIEEFKELQPIFDAANGQLKKQYAAVIAFTVIDPDTDELLFNVDDIERIAKFPWRELEKIGDAAMKLCNLFGESKN